MPPEGAGRQQRRGRSDFASRAKRTKKMYKFGNEVGNWGRFTRKNITGGTGGWVGGSETHKISIFSNNNGHMGDATSVAAYKVEGGVGGWSACVPLVSVVFASETLPLESSGGLNYFI